MVANAVQSRNTKQKEAIRRALSTADRPLSPDEILLLAQSEVENMSLGTVYRNIAAMTAEAYLTTVELPGEAPRYEVAGKEHHHHFHCKTCGKVFELKGCDLKLKPRLPRGFRVFGHEYSFFGLCADCV
jgi:Fur family transcriptional regulator, ferric uptake regulator